MKLKIDLGKILAAAAPIMVPVVVSAATGFVVKQGDKLIAKAAKSKVAP